MSPYFWAMASIYVGITWMWWEHCGRHVWKRR